ncbi:MAG: guanylate kinase [Alphaproteobacteria bacterium]|nr:guanylate kinase [Alphaproteobacteria bacterium]
MLVLSSPSGAGKTTISRRLLSEEPGIRMSVSATTRARRPGEVDGQDYFFEQPENFQLMVNRDELLEHAKVFGNYYGTPRGPVEDALSDGKDVLFDIDWQGTQQLEAKMRDDLVSVFIVPPSVAELERRLKSRAQDSDEVVAQRMAKAADELSHYPEYDYIILNNDVESSVASVRAILRAERLKRERQIGLPDFMKGLREGRT